MKNERTLYTDVAPAFIKHPVAEDSFLTHMQFLNILAI